MKDLRVRGTVTPEEQLRRWADGDPVCPSTVGECCPDFSCCRPRLLWPEEKRRSFVESDQTNRERMLAGALGTLIADAGGINAHITGGPPAEVQTRVSGQWLNQREATLVDRVAGPDGRPKPPSSTRTPPPRRRRP